MAGVSFVLVMGALVLSVVSQFEGNAEFPVDCAIVFGAAVHGTDRAGPGITRRVRTAGDLYQEGKINRVFLTGGKGEGNKLSEAAVMKKVAMLAGIAPEAITLEDQSRSTLENIRNTKPLIEDCESVVAISDRYHLSRIAWLALQHELHELQVHPASHHPPIHFQVRAVVREALAFVYLVVVIQGE
jgi:vancomycin permeability regulator SanA